MAWSHIPLTIALTGALIALATGTQLWFDATMRDLAAELRVQGTAVSASDVLVRTQWTKSGYTIDDVQVTFPTDDGPVTAMLHGVEHERQDATAGLEPAPAGSMYAAPLDVIYLPSDPSTVMAATAVDFYIEDALRRDATLIALCLTPAVALLLWHPWRRRSRNAISGT